MKEIGDVHMNIILRGVKKIFISPAEQVILKICRRFYNIQNNLIVFETEGDYWDNGRVFYEYLIKNQYNKKYEIVWFVHHPEKYKKEDNVTFVSRFHYGINWKAIKVMATAKCFLFTHPWWFTDWRKEQTVINLTHSTMQLKAGGQDISNSFNYILCASEAAKAIKRNTYHAKENQMIILGMPRNDLLSRGCDLNKLFSNYTNERIILSMVTFKQSISDKTDSKKIDKYSLNVVESAEQMNTLNRFLLENKMYLVIKIHHIQDVSILQKESYTNIYYLQDEDLEKHNIQLYELLGCADALLTDYSSVFYDYLFVQKPIGFLIDDLQNYNRGFCVQNPLDAMPGEKIFSFAELLQFLDNLTKGIDDYKEIRNQMLNEIHYYKDNHCERLMKWLQENILVED